LRVYEKAVVALANNASKIPLPPYIPPSPQASIVATRTLAQAYLTQFRVLILECHHVLTNLGLSTNYLNKQQIPNKGKNKGKKNSPLAPPAPAPPSADSLQTTTMEFLNKLEQIALYICNRYDALETMCRSSNSNKSLIEVLQLSIEALYVIISRTRKVIYARRVPEAVVKAKEIMQKRVEYMKLLFDDLNAISPSESANSYELVQQIEKIMKTEFYEEVTKEEKMQIFQAMSRDVGDGVGSFGGHWYTCPNGHVYTIGECGGAMQQSTCPECHAVVGGSAHRVASGNAVAVDFLSSIGNLQPGHRNANI